MLACMEVNKCDIIIPPDEVHNLNIGTSRRFMFTVDPDDCQNGCNACVHKYHKWVR